MAERLACEFFLIRYVPDVVKGEFVNIGVLLREVAAGGEARRGCGLRKTGGGCGAWTRTRMWRLLEALEQEIGERLRDGGECAAIRRR